MSFCDFFSSSRQMISPLSSEFSSINTSILAESFSTSKLKSAARVGIYLLRSLSAFLPSALWPISRPKLCLCSVKSSFLLGEPEVMPTFYGCKSLRVCWSISCLESIAVLWAYYLDSRSVRSILRDFSRSANWALIWLYWCVWSIITSLCYCFYSDRSLISFEFSALAWARPFEASLPNFWINWSL